MTIDAFRVINTIPDNDSEFVQTFIQSADFIATSRKEICRVIGIKTSEKK